MQLFPYLIEHAPLLVGLAVLGFAVAFIFRRLILRPLNNIDPLLLKAKGLIEFLVFLAAPAIIIFFFDQSAMESAIAYTIGYSFGTSILRI